MAAIHWFLLELVQLAVLSEALQSTLTRSKDPAPSAATEPATADLKELGAQLDEDEAESDDEKLWPFEEENSTAAPKASAAPVGAAAQSDKMYPFDAPTTKAAVEGKPLDDHKLFSTRCTMTVDIAEKKLHLDSDRGKFTIQKGGVFFENGTRVGDMPPGGVLLCEAIDTGAPKDGSAMGLFTQTTTVSYMYGTKGGNLGWDCFANKYCYAKTHKKRLFMWIGDIEDKEFLKSKEASAVKCTETMPPSNHYFRPLALKAILKQTPDLPWIVQMDLGDGWIPKEHFNSDFAEIFLNETTDIVAAAPGYRVLLNAGVLGFKNTPWAHDFLGEWFKNRCGFKDQLSIWNSLFLEWKKEYTNFTWDEQKMSAYWKTGAMDSSGGYALRHVASFFQDPHLKKYTQNKQLTNKIYFPHVTLHPNVVTNGRPVMRFDFKGHSPFVCHAKKPGTPRLGAKMIAVCNSNKQMCALKEQCKCSA